MLGTDTGHVAAVVRRVQGTKKLVQSYSAASGPSITLGTKYMCACTHVQYVRPGCGPFGLFGNAVIALAKNNSRVHAHDPYRALHGSARWHSTHRHNSVLSIVLLPVILDTSDCGVPVHERVAARNSVPC